VRLPANPAPAKNELSQKDSEEDEEKERISTRPTTRRKPVEEDEEEDDRIASRPAAKRKVVEEDDESSADEEAEPEERPRRKRKKKKRRGPSKAGSAIKLPGGLELTPFALTLVVFGGGGLVLIMIAFVFSFVFPPVAIVLSIVLYGLASLLMFGGGLWLLVVAFQDDALQGLLCLFVPLYSLYYLITHFEDCRRPFLVQVVGFVLMLGAGCPLMCTGSIHAPPMPPPQVPVPPPRR
jgi:hypothetical protein